MCWVVSVREFSVPEVACVWLACACVHVCMHVCVFVAVLAGKINSFAPQPIVQADMSSTAHTHAAATS